MLTSIITTNIDYIDNIGAGSLIVACNRHMAIDAS
jgi:hypothetical protein